MQQRVGEAANEKESRIRLQEDLNKTSSALKKVKEKQEHLLANSRAGDVSASEVQLRDERDKLLVSILLLLDHLSGRLISRRNSSVVHVAPKTSNSRSSSSACTVSPFLLSQDTVS